MANILMLLLIICHFPVTCFGCRAAIESLIWKKAPLWGTITIVFIIVVLLMLIAFFVDEVADVLDVTSSLAGSFVIYIIPGAFQLILLRKKADSRWEPRVMPIALIALGAVNFCFGIASTIVSWVSWRGEKSPLAESNH